jgi:hypothetical protein
MMGRKFPPRIFIMDTLTKIKQLLRQADYQGLIRIGAPKDEYDGEAEMIFKAVSANHCVNKISEIIWFTFYNQFCTDGKDWALSFEQAIEDIGNLDSFKNTASLIRAHILGIFKITPP